MLRSDAWRAARSRAVLASDAQLRLLLQLQACAAPRGSAEFDHLLALYRAAAAAADEAHTAFVRLHYSEGRWWLH
jgi:hypothetical protein